MKTSRFSDSQILAILKQAENGGPEYISTHLQSWVRRKGIRLTYTQPGKPQQNAYIDRLYSYERTIHEHIDKSPIC